MHLSNGWIYVTQILYRVFEVPFIGSSTIVKRRKSAAQIVCTKCTDSLQNGPT